MLKIGVLACCICVVYNCLVCFDKESSLFSFTRFSILLYICNFAVNGLEGGFGFGFRETVLPTEYVGILLDLPHLGGTLMKFLSRFHVHRVENDMIVDVVGVSVRGNQRLETTEVLSKAQTDLVSDLGGEIIVGTEGLYDVNVGPSVLFFELFFDKSELLKHCIGGAVDARNEIFVGLFPVHHVGKNIIHRAS